MPNLVALVLASALGVLSLSAWLQVLYPGTTLYPYDPKLIALILTILSVAVASTTLFGNVQHQGVGQTDGGETVVVPIILLVAGLVRLSIVIRRIHNTHRR